MTLTVSTLDGRTQATVNEKICPQPPSLPPETATGNDATAKPVACVDAVVVPIVVKELEEGSEKAHDAFIFETGVMLLPSIAMIDTIGIGFSGKKSL